LLPCRCQPITQHRTRLLSLCACVLCATDRHASCTACVLVLWLNLICAFIWQRRDSCPSSWHRSNDRSGGAMRPRAACTPNADEGTEIDDAAATEAGSLGQPRSSEGGTLSREAIGEGNGTAGDKIRVLSQAVYGLTRPLLCSCLCCAVRALRLPGRVGLPFPFAVAPHVLSFRHTTQSEAHIRTHTARQTWSAHTHALLASRAVASPYLAARANCPTRAPT
jgi:hypothetical protein